MDSESKGQLTRSPSAFLREQEAAVTVFFFIVGGALLMMFLAVFNYGRYLLAVRQAEKALEASAVSVLSYYQPTLTREMGLFALDVRNLFLPEIGKAYFVDNLGPPGAVNGQQCLEYSISFPEGSRLALNNILMAQAVDMKRIEGWTGLGLDILELFNLTDWMNAFGASGDDAEVMDALGLSALVADAGEAGNTNGIVEGAADIVGGMTDSATEGASGNSAAEYPDWLKTMDENANRSEGSNLKIWQLLMPNPPDERFSNRRLPRTAASIWDGLDTLASGSVDFWQDTLTNPISAVQAVGFFSRTIEKIEEFMSDFSGNIIRVLEQARDKIVFDEYLLQELDFATNKPVLNRYFSRCEVEYVLCGLNSAWDNVRVTALYILLLRTCVYLVDALIQGKIKDRATLVKEALQALIKGSEDVEKLYAGQ
ncbi:MAG: DUF5702 domain-containing protein, partial [Peptococcaceae bacterium]|nr:DUF5702 domain-containing protein [Peptococcaceae bacterium]